MHILLKNLAIVTGFIVIIAIMNIEVILSNTSIYILASQNTIRYCKFEGLKVIHRINILSVIIKAYN